MDEKDIIAQNLVLYRKKMGLSQLELAEKLKYSNKNISKWENGETTPNVFVLKKIADIYSITVDDLLKEPTKINETDLEEFAQHKAKRKQIFDHAMLGLANAILYAIAFIVIAILGLLNVTSFNKWLMLIYMTPFSALSIFIFVRVKRKIIEPISLSLFGWLIALSVYISLPAIENSSFIFIFAAAYQVIIVFLAIAINMKLLDKFAVKFKELKTKLINKIKK